MMQYLILLLLLITLSSQNILTKNYFVKAKSTSPYIFSGFSVLFSLSYFTITGASSFDFSQISKLLPYSLSFAVTYGLAVISSKASIGCGPLSLSTLFSSYSLMIPTFWGIFVSGDKVTLLSIGGITLLILSIILVNLKKEDSRITPKWIFFVVLGLVSNGICTLIQRLQQENFKGTYKSEFMVIALAIVAFFMLTVFITADAKRKSILSDRQLYLNAGLTGLANGFTNHMTMLLVAYLSSSVMYPTISAGSIVISTLAAIFIYREKLSKMKIAGFVIGTVSVILLNI